MCPWLALFQSISKHFLANPHPIGSFFLLLLITYLLLSAFPMNGLCKDFSTALANPTDTNEDFLRSLYYCFLEREPDGKGFKDNLAALDRGVSRAEMYRWFISFPEYKNKRKSDSEFIRDLYQGLFTREPEESGKRHWLERLSSGMKRESVLDTLLHTEEYQDIFRNQLKRDSWQDSSTEPSGTSSIPDILLYEDFEDTPTWFPRSSTQSRRSGFELFSGDKVAGSRCLRVRWEKERPDCGLNTGIPLPKADDLYLRFFCKYPKGFSWRFSHKTLGLMGIMSGVPGNTGSGGNPVNGRDAFSSRLMMSRNGICFYTYHPGQPLNRGIGLKEKPVNKYFGWPYNCEVPQWKEGEWHRVEFRMALNTPGKENGSLTAWINGLQVCQHGNLRFRDIPSLAINNLMISFYYGGDWGPEKDTYMLVDEIAVSRKPIGDYIPE